MRLLNLEAWANSTASLILLGWLTPLWIMANIHGLGVSLNHSLIDSSSPMTLFQNLGIVSFIDLLEWYQTTIRSNSHWGKLVGALLLSNSPIVGWNMDPSPTSSKHGGKITLYAAGRDMLWSWSWEIFDRLLKNGPLPPSVKSRIRNIVSSKTSPTLMPLMMPIK